MFPKYYKELEQSFSSANGSLRRPSWLFVCLAVDMRGDPELQREVMLPFQTRRFRVFGTFGDLLLIASFKALTPSVLSSLWSAPGCELKPFSCQAHPFIPERGNSPAKCLTWEQSWELSLLWEQSACRIQNETVWSVKIWMIQGQLDSLNNSGSVHSKPIPVAESNDSEQFPDSGERSWDAPWRDSSLLVPNTMYTL